MPDEPQQGETTPTPQPAQPQTPSEAQKPEAGEQENRIPQSRFNEVVSAKNALQKRLDDLEKDMAEAKRKEAEEAGRFKDLYESTKPKADRAEELEKTLGAILERRKSEIPAEFHDLIPTGDAVSQMQWIEQATAKGLFAPKSAPDLNPGKQGDSKKPNLTPEQQKAARQWNMTDEEWAARLTVQPRDNPS